MTAKTTRKPKEVFPDDYPMRIDLDHPMLPSMFIGTPWEKDYLERLDEIPEAVVMCIVSGRFERWLFLPRSVMQSHPVIKVLVERTKVLKAELRRRGILETG